MGQFHDLMDRDLTIRGYADSTRYSYLKAVAMFFRHCDLPPDQVTIEHVNQYQAYMIRKRQVSWGRFNGVVCALRFFFNVTLKRGWTLQMMPLHKAARQLPEIPSPEQLAKLFSVMENLKHRAIFMTAYGAGLRLGEVRRLRVTDIDSERMVIRVQQGKGRKDRYSVLPQAILPVLREYWKREHPQTWLFPGLRADEPLCGGIIELWLRDYVRRAGLRRRITMHSLRHAFATHMLERGGNIRVIQELLGHRSLRTTEKYMHLATTFLQDTKSPLDALEVPETADAPGR